MRRHSLRKLIAVTAQSATGTCHGSTIWSHTVVALAGAVLTLFDTRLVLLIGAGLSARAGWRMLGWSRLAQPVPRAAAEQAWRDEFRGTTR